MVLLLLLLFPVSVAKLHHWLSRMSCQSSKHINLIFSRDENETYSRYTHRLTFTRARAHTKRLYTTTIRIKYEIRKMREIAEINQLDMRGVFILFYFFIQCDQPLTHWSEIHSLRIEHLFTKNANLICFDSLHTMCIHTHTQTHKRSLASSLPFYSEFCAFCVQLGSEMHNQKCIYSTTSIINPSNLSSILSHKINTDFRFIVSIIVAVCVCVCVVLPFDRLSLRYFLLLLLVEC